jgi:hypothetical protein
MTVGEVIMWLVAPFCECDLVGMEVRRAVINGKINRGGY